MEKQQIKSLYPQIKEMYLGGVTITEMARTLNISSATIYNAVSNMCLPRRSEKDESNLVYADNSVNLGKVVIYGKRYVDVTPIYAPR